MKNVSFALISAFIYLAVTDGVLQGMISSKMSSAMTTPSCREIVDFVFELNRTGTAPFEIFYTAKPNLCALEEDAFQLSCVGMGAVRFGFSEIQFPFIQAACCTFLCDIVTYLIRFCSGCPLTSVYIGVQTESNDKPTEIGLGVVKRPIVARFRVQSKGAIRQQIISIAYRYWQSTAVWVPPLSYLNVHIKLITKRRYHVIFRFKDKQGPEFD